LMRLLRRHILCGPDCALGVVDAGPARKKKPGNRFPGRLVGIPG